MYFGKTLFRYIAFITLIIGDSYLSGIFIKCFKRYQKNSIAKNRYRFIIGKNRTDPP